MNTSFNFSRDPNKRDIFVSYNRSYTSKYIDHTLKVYSDWINLYKKDYNVILLANSYEDTFIKKFCSYVGIFDGYFCIKDPKINDWDSYREYFKDEIDKIKKEYHPFLFIEIGGLLNTNFKRGKEKKWDLAMKENKNIRFLSVKNGLVIALRNIIFCKTFNLKYNQFLIDSQECNLSKFEEMKDHSYERFFGYSSSSVGFSYHPFLKLYYSKNKEDIKNKEYEWLFGFAILTPDRKWLSSYYDYFNSLPGNNKIYLKDKYREVDTFIKKDLYIEELKKSKQTLMLPPYDNDFFSMIRFLESLSLSVLPRIYKTVFIDEVDSKNEFKDLIIEDNINSLIDEKERIRLLKKYNHFIESNTEDEIIAKKLVEKKIE